MRLISWNVNGLRAVMKKGFEDIFWNLNADYFCLQETKLQAGQIDLELPSGRATPAPLFLPGRRRCLSATTSVSLSTTPRAGSSRWNMKTSIWSVFTPPTPRTG